MTKVLDYSFLNLRLQLGEASQSISQLKDNQVRNSSTCLLEIRKLATFVVAVDIHYFSTAEVYDS